MSTKPLLRLILVVVAMAGTASAEWSSDPSQNLLVFGGDGDQVQPVVALDGSGNTWISCFSIETVGADTLHRVRLQKLDLLGNEMLPSGGVILGEHPSMAWYSDYDLLTDPAGNVLVVYAAAGDAGRSSIYANLMTPSGTFPWGTAGVTVYAASGGDAYSPTAMLLPGGGVVLAWTFDPDDGPETIRMQRLGSSGQPQWGSGVTVQAPSGQNADFAGLTPCGEGFLLSFVGRFESGSTLSVYGYVRRYDQEGAAVWAEPVAYCASGSMFEFFFPQSLPDGGDGVFLAWEEYAGKGSKTSRIQHVDADGTTGMAAGGTQVSTATGNAHSGPSMTPSPEGDPEVFWIEWNDLSLDHGIYAQRFSPAGEPAWPDTGIALIPLVDNDYFGLITRPSNGSDVLCVYGYKPGGAPFSMIKAMLVTDDGGQAWDDWPTVISDTAKDKGLLSVTDLCWGQQWIFAWEEIRGDDPDIYAQNLKLDGTLGPGGLGVEEGVQGGPLRVLGAFPNPCRGATVLAVAGGDASDVDVEVFDLSGRMVRSLSSGGSDAGGIALDLSGVEPGIYLVRLLQGGGSVSGRLMVLR